MLQRSPALQSALEREAPAIQAAARLRNKRETDEKGVEMAGEIAKRIHAAIGNDTPEQLIMVHVMTEVGRQQFALLGVKGNPLQAILQAQAAHAGGPAAEALARLGSVSKEGLINAFKIVYEGGPPAEATKVFRAEFERSKAIFRLMAFQSGAQSEMGRVALLSTNTMLDGVLTLLEHNPKDPDVTRLGYEMLITYKAKSPEVERRIGAALADAKDAEAQKARGTWREVRESIASLELQQAAGVTLSAPEQADLMRSKAEEQRLVQRLNELSTLGRNQDKPFEAAEGIEQLKALLEPDEVLLSFVEYQHNKPESAQVTTRPNTNGAFVLTRSGLTWVSLGGSEAMAQNVDAYLKTVAAGGATLEQKRAAANKLYQAAFAPLEPALGSVKKVRVVPDGALQLIPLDALHDGKSWLADRYQFTYAFSERQLLGEHAPALDFDSPLVLVPGPYSAKPQPFRAGERLKQENFPALDGAAAEGRRVQALLPKARLLTGSSATEASLFSARPPRILHIAGHGVVLPIQKASGAADRGLLLQLPAGSEKAAGPSALASQVDPMVLSALVMSPDPKRKSDGFLTAFEAATAPLWGTTLVVLSACESGRGDPDRIKGVHGLRRAFFTAGADSLVTSLWSVSDKSTEELMGQFYGQLKAGVGRAEALRRASATLRAKNEDPFFWGPFILMGDTSPVSFTAAAAPSSPTGEDADSRFKRAMAMNRLRHTTTKMGQAAWASAGVEEQAVDAYVTRGLAGQPAPLVLTLLGKTQSVSLLVRDYPGPGKYSIEGGQLSAGASVVKDALQANIRKLTVDAATTKATSGTLEVLQDAVAGGFIGSFTLRLKDGRLLSGGFRLESALPALPDWMQPQK
jgi:CHAT domain-containing protein